MGWRVGNRFLGVQPKCRPGVLYYLPFLLFDQPPRHDEDRVADFISAKRDTAGGYIEQWCGARAIEPVLRMLV